MITCRELTELVTDYLEGRMPPEERASFRLHADLCRPCQDFLEQMEQTVEILGRLPVDFQIPGEVRARLKHLFCSWKEAHVVEDADVDPDATIDLGPVRSHLRHGPCAPGSKRDERK